MSKRLLTFAIPALAALGLMAGSLTPAAAGVVTTVIPATSHAGAADTTVRKVDWRRHHRHGRRHHRERRHWRHHRGSRAGIYLHFGGPRVVRPRYVRPGYSRLPGAHVRWCYERYRSYRASDNTFQPYHGPRRSCRSPYL